MKALLAAVLVAVFAAGATTAADEPAVTEPICWPATQGTVAGVVCQTFTPDSTPPTTTTEVTTSTSPTTSLPPSSTTTSTSSSTTSTTSTVTTTTAAPTTTIAPTTSTTVAPTTTTTVPPTPGGFPDASTTGPTGTLTAYTGPLTITVAGTVIENRMISGCVRIEAPRVVIRNSRISCTNFFVVYSPTVRSTADRALLEDVEITCNASNGTGVVGHSIIVRRADIHDCENGAHADQFMTIEHSWIHAPFNGNGAHADGVQVSIGLRGMVLFHNRIEIPNGTSTLIADVAIHSMTVDSNFLSGGSYTLYCSTSFSSFETVTNNVWLASERQPAPNDYPYRPFTLCDKSGTVFTGNTWSDGRPLTKDPATHVD